MWGVVGTALGWGGETGGLDLFFAVFYYEEERVLEQAQKNVNIHFIIVVPE